MADLAYLKCPHSDEVKAVEATAEALTPLMAQGWHQVPAPKGQPVNIVQEEKQDGQH